MKKILYLECNSGISGDMTVAALLDLGADRQKMKHVLESMEVEGYRLEFRTVEKRGIQACKFDVILEEDDEHETEHHHGTHHSHTHRNLEDICKIIEKADAEIRVKDLAKKMFRIVAEAESAVHGLPVNQVHFHEVGAVDSIVDLMAAAFCFCDLGIEEVVVSALGEGSGFITCQHGTIPVPAPATVEIARKYGLSMRNVHVDGEMVTPTGAAIAAAVRTKDRLPEIYRILKTGIGAGTKEFPHANILRAMILETDEKSDTTWMMECNVDDSTGEMMGLAMEQLFDAGALDVWFTPVYMKKNRPGYLLSVLCEKEQIPQMEEWIFETTTTIGIRKYPVERTVLDRKIVTVDTCYGTAKVKVCSRGSKKYYYPEYESVRQISRSCKKDFQTVYFEIKKAAEEV